MGDEHPQSHRGERRPWARVAEVAARQHHQVTLDDLRGAGLSDQQIERAVGRGQLHPVHRGVLSVGAPPTSARARWMAAVLATDGTLSDRSAAAFWEVWNNARTEEHVIVERSARWRHRGVRPHRPRRFDRERDSVVVDGIRVTTPARTLLDLAATLSSRQLRDALQEARVRRLVGDDALRDVLARHPTHRGARRLGLALTGPHTKSELERRFVQLCRERSLPAPDGNVALGGFEVDALFAEHGVVVELDGRQHAGAWARDAAKDEALRALGLTVLRFTWWDVTSDAGRTAARVRSALGRRTPPPSEGDVAHGR